MEMNTVERATKTEMDTGTEQKGVGKLGWFMNCNIPRTHEQNKKEWASQIGL